MRGLGGIPEYVLLAVAVLAAPMLSAQSPVPDQPVSTLHVYMDLIQVPTLVLDSEHGRMKPVAPSKFLVSLDSGPAFRPTHVRQQGDDPITLGILLDPSTEPDSMPNISSALASLAPDYLHPRDHVTLYAMDCALLQTLDDVPADHVLLQSATDRILKNWLQSRKERHTAQACPNRMELLDAMDVVDRRLAKLPGRRVLLAITNGNDLTSSTHWNALREFAQLHGIAIFGLMQRIPGSSSRFNSVSTEDLFNVLCQTTGGDIVWSNAAFTRFDLKRFVAMLRERYIIEFPRPRNDSAGRHQIVITIPRVSYRAYIRSSGVVYMGRDDVDADPNTIPRDTTDAPEIGKRKILTPP